MEFVNIGKFRENSGNFSILLRENDVITNCDCVTVQCVLFVNIFEGSRAVI